MSNSEDAGNGTDDSLILGTFKVYRPNGESISFSGPNLTCDVRSGCLVVLAEGSVSRVFAPNQWTTVNVTPV